MKKIWPYITAFLAGFSTMAIIALKWFNGDDYSMEFKKIKSKKSPGGVSVPIQVDVPETGKKKPKKKLFRRKNKKT